MFRKKPKEDTVFVSFQNAKVDTTRSSSVPELPSKIPSKQAVADTTLNDLTPEALENYITEGCRALKEPQEPKKIKGAVKGLFIVLKAGNALSSSFLPGMGAAFQFGMWVCDQVDTLQQAAHEWEDLAMALRVCTYAIETAKEEVITAVAGRVLESKVLKRAKLTLDVLVEMVALTTSVNQLCEVAKKRSQQPVDVLRNFCRAKSMQTARSRLQKKLYPSLAALTSCTNGLNKACEKLPMQTVTGGSANLPSTLQSANPAATSSTKHDQTLGTIRDATGQSAVQHEAPPLKELPSMTESQTALYELLEHPPPLNVNLKRHLEFYHPGTRKVVFADLDSWLFDVQEGTNTTFWINGQGGQGKSIIAAEYVRRCRDDKEYEGQLGAVAAFFCRHNDGNLNDPRNAVLSLAFQLALQLPEVEQALTRAKEALQARLAKDSARLAKDSVEESMLFEDLIQVPLKAVTSKLPVLLVIDGLDELRDDTQSQEFLTLIGQHFPKLPSFVKVLVTSRPETNIESALIGLNPVLLAQRSQEDDDVLIYIRDKLGATDYFKSKGFDFHGKNEDVLQRLVKPTERVFLHARLLCMHAESLDPDAPLEEALKELEGAVVANAAYKETLDRVRNKLFKGIPNENLQRRNILFGFLKTMLNVLACAAVPLHYLQVANLSEEASECLTTHVLGALSLMFTRTDDGRIEPTHKTVMDYLTGDDSKGSGYNDYHVDVFAGYSVLASTCVGTVLVDEFGSQASEVEDDEKFQRALNYEHALLYGHVYLGQAIAIWTPDVDQEASDRLKEAIEHWHTLLLKERRQDYSTVGRSNDERGRKDWSIYIADEVAEPIIEKDHVARANLAWWLLAQVKLEEGRKYRLVSELETLESFLDKKADMQQAKDLSDIFRCTRKLFASHWVPAPNIDEGCAAFLENIPLTTPLFLAKTFEAVLKRAAVGNFQQRQLQRMPPAALVTPSALKAVLRGHMKPVTSVALYRNSKGHTKIVSGSEDNTVRTWDAATGIVIKEFEGQLGGHTGWVNSVAFSPDGKTIASGSSDMTVRMWEAGTGNELLKAVSVGLAKQRGEETSLCHTHKVNSVAFSRDSKMVVSGSKDKKVQIWNVATREKLAVFEVKTEVNSVAFNHDGTMIALGGEDATVRTWKLDPGASGGSECHRRDATVAPHTKPINSVAFSPDGMTIVSGSDDMTVRLWEAKSDKWLCTFEGHSDRVTSVAFSPDGKTIVSGSMDKTVRTWTTTREKPLTPGLDRSAASVASDPTPEKSAVDIQKAGSIFGFALKRRKRNQLPAVEKEQSPSWKRDSEQPKQEVFPVSLLNELSGGGITSVAFNHDGSTIVSGSKDHSIRLWDAAYDSPVLTFKGHSKEVTTVQFTPDGKNIVSGSNDGTTITWSLSGRQLDTEKKKSVSIKVNDIELTLEDGTVLTARFDPSSKTVKVIRKQMAEELDGTRKQLNSETIPLPNLNGTTFVADAGPHSRGVKRDQGPTNGHTAKVTAVAFSPDGTRLVSGSIDKTAKVWDTSTGDLVHTLIGHDKHVTLVAFSPDGETVVTCSDDTTLRTWDASNGKELMTLHGHSGSITAVAFSPDSRTIVSGSKDTTVRIWNVAE